MIGYPQEDEMDPEDWDDEDWGDEEPDEGEDFEPDFMAIMKGDLVPACSPKNNQPICNSCSGRAKCEDWVWQVAPLTGCQRKMEASG